MALHMNINILQKCQKIVTLPLRYLTTAGTLVGKPHLTLPTIVHTRIYDVQREINQNSSFVPYKRLSKDVGCTKTVNEPSLMIERVNNEYKCPTKSRPWVEIVDIVNYVSAYECPNTSKAEIDLILPTMHLFNNLNIDRKCPGIERPEKLAKKRVRKCYSILRIRKRKMNHHKLLKMRKRLKFLLKKLMFRKREKKEARTVAEIKAIYADAEAFDPLAEIKAELILARRGGYRIDVTGDMGKKS